MGCNCNGLSNEGAGSSTPATTNPSYDQTTPAQAGFSLFGLGGKDLALLALGTGLAYAAAKYAKKKGK